ncbi:MAG: hypothetical protein ACI8V2_001077 [Candidatus Latescibacterota bacterium]|jgi:hypothetical protein
MTQTFPDTEWETQSPNDLGFSIDGQMPLVTLLPHPAQVPNTYGCAPVSDWSLRKTPAIGINSKKKRKNSQSK